MLLRPLESTGVFSGATPLTLATISNNSLWGNFSPFKTVFIIRGIGYKVALISKTTSNDEFRSKEFLSNRYLLVRVGYSYSVYLPVPNYIGIRVGKKDRKLTIYGGSNNQVAIFAKHVYALRSPSVYTGRGIRYKGRASRRKLGKKDIRKGRFF